MKQSKSKNLKRRFHLACGIAFLGFLLMLTELHGGPWAGTYIGGAMLILGALATLRIKNEKHIEGRKTDHEIHLRVYRRSAGRDDAA